MNYLFILLILVLFYEIYKNTNREGFYYSINPCFDNVTPYIKFSDTYVCFDEKDKINDTLGVFYGKQKECNIYPRGTTMLFYDSQGNVIDSINNDSTKVCKPYKVSVTDSQQS